MVQRELGYGNPKAENQNSKINHCTELTFQLPKFSSNVSPLKSLPLISLHFPPLSGPLGLCIFMYYISSSSIYLFRFQQNISNELSLCLRSLLNLESPYVKWHIYIILFELRLGGEPPQPCSGGPHFLIHRSAVQCLDTRMHCYSRKSCQGQPGPSWLYLQPPELHSKMLRGHMVYEDKPGTEACKPCVLTSYYLLGLWNYLLISLPTGSLKWLIFTTPLEFNIVPGMQLIFSICILQE